MRVVLPPQSSRVSATKRLHQPFSRPCPGTCSPDPPPSPVSLWEPLSLLRSPGISSARVLTVPPPGSFRRSSCQTLVVLDLVVLVPVKRGPVVWSSPTCGPAHSRGRGLRARPREASRWHGAAKPCHVADDTVSRDGRTSSIMHFAGTPHSLLPCVLQTHKAYPRLARRTPD